MSTSEERREVAERLRNEGRALDAIDATTEIASLTLDDALGINHMSGWCDVFERLADLIDPQERTCRIARIGGDAIAAGWYACSECGLVYPPCNDDTAKWALRFCPHCGARVVEG